ncbi:MAG: hypothetical protein ACYTFY_17280 [Planctomycetota bacterium]|jgi:hypothetical protein
MFKKILIAAVFAAFVTEGVLLACAGCGCSVKKKVEKKEEVKEQKTCPVMGGKINKKLFVDVKGKRIYMCCAGCKSEIKADPDKYIKILKDKGEGVADAPAKNCKKCKEVKGSEECAKKCKKKAVCGIGGGCK